MVVNNKVYAAYEGDEFICMGTIKEIGLRLGISDSAVRKNINLYRKWLSGDLPHRIIFCLDEEGMEEDGTGY